MPKGNAIEPQIWDAAQISEEDAKVFSEIIQRNMKKNQEDSCAIRPQNYHIRRE